MKFNVTILTRNNPPILYYDSSRNRFGGCLRSIGVKYLALLNSLNIKILTVDRFEFGLCKNAANCTGAIGMIQRGEAHLSSYPYPLNLIPSSVNGIVTGPIFSENSCGITSVLPTTEVVREDVLKSLSIFSPPIVLALFGFLLLLSCLFPMVITYKGSEFGNFWPVIATLLGRGSASYYFTKFHLRSIFLSTSFITLCISIIYSGSFTTDLTSTQPVKTIETLSDIVNAVEKSEDVIYLVLGVGRCNHLLHARDSIHERELLKVAQTATSWNFTQIVTSHSPSKIITIDTNTESDCFRTAVCSVIEPPLNEPWYRSVVPFEVTLNIWLISRSLPKKAREEIIRIAYRALEGQIIIHNEGTWARLISECNDPTSGCFHRTAFHKKPTLYETYGYKPLSLQNFSQSFADFGYGILFATIIFVCEIITGLIIDNNQRTQLTLIETISQKN